MNNLDTYTIDIRPRRQATFPKPILDRVGLTVGDKLVVRVEKDKIILQPQKKEALDALEEIQKIVRKSGISEEEIQQSLREYRIEAYKKRQTRKS